jgi:bacterial/archaeal transporter family-2 protein
MKAIRQVGRFRLKLAIIVGAIGALLTGVAIGVQSTLTSRAGSMIGDVRTGLFTNFFGGVIAGAIILLIFIREGQQMWKLPGTAVIFAASSGLLGIFIITGVSFSLQRAGIAAGLATLILGQLLVSTIIDTFGIGGVEAVPLSSQRVVGLLVVGLGVYLLLPRS